jgi:hypothetical protein
MTPRLTPMTPAQRAEVNARLDALEAEVTGLREAMSELETQVGIATAGREGATC